MIFLVRFKMDGFFFTCTVARKWRFTLIRDWIVHFDVSSLWSKSGRSKIWPSIINKVDQVVKGYDCARFGSIKWQVTVMLVTTLCWWFYDGDRLKMLVTESLCWRLLSLCWWFSQCIKSVTNIKLITNSNLSPKHLVTNIRHQHRCNLTILWAPLDGEISYF